MSALPTDEAGLSDRIARIADLAGHLGWTVGVAESLTSGATASALGSGPDTSEWFRGAIVAYSSHVKHDLLQVPDGPVVSREAATMMAREAARLLGADIAVALTGVGGPDAQDGEPPGTVWLAVHYPHEELAEMRFFSGGPQEVCAGAVEQAVDLLVRALADAEESRRPGT